MTDGPHSQWSDPERFEGDGCSHGVPWWDPTCPGCRREVAPECPRRRVLPPGGWATLAVLLVGAGWATEDPWGAVLAGLGGLCALPLVYALTVGEKVRAED